MIVSYGAYIPPTRLSLASLGGGLPKEDGPEKAVAWFDEDSVTLGVAAAIDCLQGFDRASVDALVFATTTAPFREKQAAALVARALDLRRDLRTSDVTGSLRAGTQALAAAADAVKAGSARRVLVVASDCRLAAPGSALERNLGDGAAAFLVGAEDAIAELDAWHAVSDEIVDVWRGPRDEFVHGWEERFIVQESYLPRLTEAVQGVLEKAGIGPEDVERAALQAPDARSHARAARGLGLAKQSLLDPLFGRLGNTGASFAPLLLVAALEEARPGERVLVAAHADGAEAFLLRTTAHLEKLAPRRGVAWHLARRRVLPSYDLYRKARGLEAREWPAASDAGLSATVHYRERDAELGLIGQRCTNCGGLQFPKQRLCETCYTKDAFEDERLSDRTGRVVTFTLDHFFPVPEPPTIVTITEIDGARVHLQLVNARPEDVRPGLAVEPVFRRIHETGGRPNYHWKATLADQGPVNQRPVEES